MNLIKGKDVVLYEKTLIGYDDFNAPIYSVDPVVVSDVLIEPASNEAITSEFEITGKRIAYTLHIPKDDAHNWIDAVVEFYGMKWNTYGDCLIYDPDLTPLRWNKKVKVEHYE